jgi:hypothetical protein
MMARVLLTGINWRRISPEHCPEDSGVMRASEPNFSSGFDNGAKSDPHFSVAVGEDGREDMGVNVTCSIRAILSSADRRLDVRPATSAFRLSRALRMVAKIGLVDILLYLDDDHVRGCCVEFKT